MVDGDGGPLGVVIAGANVPDCKLLQATTEAIVVAAPDPLLGERVCAVLRLRPGNPMPGLEQIRDHFAAAGLARQKWPEQLYQVDDYPRTASGKVQKYLVRRSLAESLATHR